MKKNENIAMQTGDLLAGETDLPTEDAPNNVSSAKGMSLIPKMNCEDALEMLQYFQKLLQYAQKEAYGRVPHLLFALQFV